VFTATDLNAGAHSFRAFYAGTANVLPSTSTARSLTVAKRPSDTDLVAVRNPTTAGNAVVVATVEAKDVLPTGRVRVFEGADARGTGLLGSARIKDLVVGQAHGCVLWSDGAVACWGRIGEKRLGARPLVMDDLGSEVDDIAGSAGGVCARSANGQIACIGRVGTARAALVRSDPDLSLTARGDRAACRVVDPEGDIVCSGDSGPGTPLAVKRASVRITLRGLNAGKNGLLAKYAGSANLLGSQSEKLVLTIQ
jgi:hypothetical protein